MSAQASHWIFLGILNIPVYLGLGWLFFDDWSGFFECVRFWLTPDWISMFRGEWMDDWWGTLKLGVFFALCGGILFGEYQMFYGSSEKAKVSVLRPNQSLISDPTASSMVRLHAV